MTLLRAFAAVATLVLGFATGCGDDAQFTARYATGFTQSDVPRVSVLGIFKDGRLNSEAWPDVGPGLSGPICHGGCEALFMPGKDLPPAAAAAISDFARDNGVTEELMGELAPFAEGDAILLLTVAGKPPRQTADSKDKKPGAPSTPPPGRRGARGMGPTQSPIAPHDTSVYQISAILYSKVARKSVAEIAMAYTGPSIDDALKKFAARITLELPAVKGAGWKPEVNVDPEKIRKLGEDVPASP